MHKLAILTGASALVFTNLAQAQDASGEEETQLKRVVVSTALRYDASLESSTSSVTVIDEEEIQRSAAADLPTLLQSYPGVAITSYGGQGATSNVFVRGMSSSQTLVLINGIRVSSATAGTTSLFNVPLSAISRIEVAKGAHSAQWGADAIGGVINIITKDGSACPGDKTSCTTLTAGVTYPWGASTDINTRGQTASGLRYSLGGTLMGTQGYDFTLPGSWGHEPDKDGFRRGSLNANLAQDVEWGEIYLNGIYSRGQSQYDSLFPELNEVKTDTFAGKVGTRIDHSDDWSTTLELMHAFDRARDFRDGLTTTNTFETHRTGLSLRTLKSFEIGGITHSLGGGIEGYREDVSSNTIDYSVDSRDVGAVFAQYGLTYEALTLNGGLRHDENEQFGNATTYNLGASYEVVPDVILRASYGTGFRAPSFNDLYYPGFSNPDLKPERSRGYEVGMLWNISDATSLDVAFYQTWLTDAIASYAPDYLPFNVARARVTGVEATLSHQFNDRWHGKAMLDVRDPRDTDSGNYIAYRERFKATLEAGYKPTEKVDLTARVLYGASRYANADNTEKMPAYTTIDFSAIYNVNETSMVRFSIANLFDEDYALISGYRAPGRTVSLSFSKTF
jgi:vitamin B12 transporter